MFFGVPTISITNAVGTSEPGSQVTRNISASQLHSRYIPQAAAKQPAQVQPQYRFKEKPRASDRNVVPAIEIEGPTPPPSPPLEHGFVPVVQSIQRGIVIFGPPAARPLLKLADTPQNQQMVVPSSLIDQQSQSDFSLAGGSSIKVGCDDSLIRYARQQALRVAKNYPNMFRVPGTAALGGTAPGDTTANQNTGENENKLASTKFSPGASSGSGLVSDFAVAVLPIFNPTRLNSTSVTRICKAVAPGLVQSKSNEGSSGCVCAVAVQNFPETDPLAAVNDANCCKPWTPTFLDPQVSEHLAADIISSPNTFQVSLTLSALVSVTKERVEISCEHRTLTLNVPFHSIVEVSYRGYGASLRHISQLATEMGISQAQLDARGISILCQDDTKSLPNGRKAYEVITLYPTSGGSTPEGNLLLSSALFRTISAALRSRVVGPTQSVKEVLLERRDVRTATSPLCVSGALFSCSFGEDLSNDALVTKAVNDHRAAASRTM